MEPARITKNLNSNEPHNRTCHKNSPMKTWNTSLRQAMYSDLLLPVYFFFEYKELKLDSYLEFRPIGMTETLVFVVEGRRGIFPLLEFVDYVSFYPHNYTNNFRFVSFLTFFRTCRVQIYDIKRKGTSFRRVILGHWREKTEKSGIGTLLWNSYTAYILRLRLRKSARQRLVFIIVPEEIFLGGIVGPNVFNAFIHFTFILYFLQVLEHLERST